MKRIISTILVCVLLVGSIFTLASCGKPSGTYKSGITTFTFDGDNVEMSIGSVSVDATYEITKNDEDGKKYIEFDFGDSALASVFNAFSSPLEYAADKDDDGSYISIGGTKYYKTK